MKQKVTRVRTICRRVKSEVDMPLQDEVPRAFLCPYPECGKTYPKNSQLRTHLLRHSRERPFACQWPGCRRRYSRLDQLARHECSAHTGYKPHNCKICNKKFVRSDHVAKHIKIHSKPKETREKSSRTATHPRKRLQSLQSLEDPLPPSYCPSPIASPSKALA